MSWRTVRRPQSSLQAALPAQIAVLLSVRAAWKETWDGQGGLIEFVIEYLPDSSVRDRLIELAKLENKKSLQEVATQHGSSGYVVESVPLALLGAERIGTLGFPVMLEELVACGGDTDTVASIAGQIAGALIGKAALPGETIKHLPDLQIISRIAEEFSDVVA